MNDGPLTHTHVIIIVQSKDAIARAVEDARGRLHTRRYVRTLRLQNNY